MTIKDFNSKIQTSAGKNTLLNSVRHFTRIDRAGKDVFEETLNVGWATWGDGGLETNS